MIASTNSIQQQPWSSTLPTLTHLQRCKTQRDINQLHARIITTGLIKNTYLTTKLILNFSTSPHQPLVNFSHYILFSQTQTHLWNLLIKSFSHGDNPKQAVLLFHSMLCRGVDIDGFTFSLVLKACSRVGLVHEGLQVQGLIAKSGVNVNVFLQNSLINMYLKCGCVEYARMAFDTMPVRDSVSWNLMINGYAKNGMVEIAKGVFMEMPDDLRNLRSWNCLIKGYVNAENGVGFAWDLFRRMPERDLVSWNVMIDGLVKCGEIEVARKLFSLMPVKDAVSWASMIDGYMKIGRVEEAECLFDEMPVEERDVITWNALMAGYVQNGFYAEAIKLFREMTLDRRRSRLVPDDTTFVVILSAVAELGLIGEGEQIHKYIVENGMCLDGMLGVSVIDMYSKCGNIETAMFVFTNLDEKSVDHWNAIIGGLAVNGMGELALDLFMEMERQYVKPDDITFIGVLNACNHAGMVNEGVMIFEHMRRAHCIKPKLQHYACMVDILGRAGYLEEAMKVIEAMPFKPNDMVWRALLSACKNHENFDMGIRIATCILETGFCNSSACVLLSNLYASSKMWSDVSRVRSMMKEKDITKVPGCSWIELEGTVHKFVVGDKSHPEAQEIYAVINKLNFSMETER